MVLLLSSGFFKLLKGFLFGSLANLAVISKTAFPRVNSLLARDTLPFTFFLLKESLLLETLF